ncbi:chloride channel protein [Rhabdothermincola salaria]|uniref:chloride channel protein n=1 Tax=Rhabdothermincola salaria TaxID=2903142 RepID=UPI001E5A2961|nr:chloride channel protein [Rhabdothermincola salaria]MCD9624523.1 chloride channel protein [Rhabdothermincola salaria]
MGGRRAGELGSVAALLAVAMAGGALAALITAGFIWLYESGLDLVWDTLPDRAGVDPYSSWWPFAILIGGGLVVGLGQMLLGNQPESIERVVAKWKNHGQVEPRTIPATMLNSLFALVAGGPVGFEAALAGLLGGSATWISDRVHGARRLVRQAFGAENDDALPRAVRQLPYWLAAVAGLVTYRWLPFGQLDTSFRFGTFDGDLGVGVVLVAFGFGALAALPIAWGAHIANRAEEAARFRRAPIPFAMVAGLLFALLALPTHLVLFSGQTGYQSLPELGYGTLAYLVVAKWVALVIALGAGWRGGPVFPLFFSVSAAAVLLADGLGLETDIVMVAGTAAVSAVFLKGRIAAAFLLTMYVAPPSYAVVILIGAAGAAAALALAGPARLLPPEPTATGGEPAGDATSGR